MGRQIEGFKVINPQVRKPVTIDPEASPVSSVGVVPAAVRTYVTPTELGDNLLHQTVLALAALPQVIPNGASEWCGTKLYTFPQGRILVLGVTASLAPTTTTVIADSIASGATGTLAAGTVTDDGTHTGTKVNLLPDGNFTTSTTINEAAAAVTKTLAASAHFDGTSAAVDAFLNAKVATGTIDGGLTWTGNITMTWVFLGDY